MTASWLQVVFTFINGKLIYYQNAVYKNKLHTYYKFQCLTLSGQQTKP